MLSVSMADSEKGNEHDFFSARLAEIEGLQKRKVFDKVKRSTVPAYVRVYRTGWVYKAKIREDGKLVLRSRLVARNYRDSGAATVPTRSPTISIWGPRLMICLASMVPERNVYLRDISQAYAQSEGYLKRDIFLEAPPEMQLTRCNCLFLLCRWRVTRLEAKWHLFLI